MRDSVHTPVLRSPDLTGDPCDAIESVLGPRRVATGEQRSLVNLND